MIHRERIKPLVLPLLSLILIGTAAGAAETLPAQEIAGALPAQEVAGDWQGVIEIPGAPLAVEISLRNDDGAWSGTIDIPAQGAQGLALEDIAVDADGVRFTISGVPGNPTFEGALVEESIAGTFTQAGQTFPFELQRSGPAEEDREPEDAEDAEAALPAEPAPDPQAAGEAYEDPEGRFSVSIPTNWEWREEDGFVRLSGREEGVELYLLVVEEEDLETAIAEGWARVDPDFALEPDQVQEPPSEPGVEQTVLIDYESDDDRVVQALGQRHEGMAYLVLVDAELEAAQRRAAQLNIVFTGFEIAALEDEDLTGIAPLPIADVLPELKTFIGDALAEAGVPGAAVAIVQDGEVVYSEGFGTREAGGGEPITPDTHMMIGSTGKTMTTLLMAILVDEGRLEWDSRAVEVLPEFAVADPELTREITVRNLVCACTGVPRRDLEIFFNADELDAEGIVESLRTFEFFTDFGEAFQYSNQLVAAGGYAAAAADGAEAGALFEGYAASLRERVLEPVGMPNTTLSFEEVRERGEHGIPHQVNFSTGAYEPIPLAVEEVLVPLAPAGSHWSTAEDMARYLITQLAMGAAPDGTRIVSEENLRTTREPQVPISATMSYGLGWMVDDYKGLELLHHGGNSLGFTSDFAFLPDAGVGIVVLTNAQGSNAFNSALRTRLFELVYAQPLQSEESLAFGLSRLEEMLAEMQEAVAESVDPDAVEPWLGRWDNASLGEVDVALESGRLMLDAGEFRTELRPVLDDDGEIDNHVMYDAPLAGIPVDLRDDEAGAPVLQVGEGATAYIFSRPE